MLLFRSEEHVDDWCKERRNPKGAVLSLEQLWGLASIWHRDRLQPGWRLRTSFTAPSHHRATLGSMKGGDMRRGYVTWMLILLILITVGVGIGAYNWGVHEGLEESGRAVVGYDSYGHHHGHGFFPFGLIL